MTIQSEAPDWLVELIANTQRLMSSTPRSVADAVWVELQRRIELEVKESMELSMRGAADNFLSTATAQYRLKEREQP